MRDVKYLVLLAAALFAGGCIMEPLEPESDEELGTVAAGVSTALPASEGDDEGDVDEMDNVNSPFDGRRLSRPGVTTSADEKPQPDPWISLRRTDDTNTSPSP